ncbi:hypothetical protein ACFE04_019007 [Oxalis oulophora]
MATPPSPPPPSSNSSGSSSFSPPLSPSNFSNLPVMALREKIVEKVLENRVTLIIGETGCGKSSQVPQFLLEENMEPILCTQPRRFAVVAVAKMVASSRNCDLGGEVGYHIGHAKNLSARSKLVFKTAGVLLDELRDKGMNALKYKVIILDEVHERSPESDLVLVCLKQFLLKNNDLRVVLMSATADINRYKDYFRDLGRGERVEVLAIPSSSQKTNFQRGVCKLLGRPEDSSDSLSLSYCSGPSPSMADADMKPQVHDLIHDLILYLDKNEVDIEKSILVFLPTYYALEQQWNRLKLFTSKFKVRILHRSIDTEQALMAMKIWKSHRKVILATNIAESSVTIPKVAFVIDSCRSLQVFWDQNRKKDSPELVWVSKSQAEQRRGRTGRTCHGHVYRLVTSSFYNKLEDYECPAILRLSLRQQYRTCKTNSHHPEPEILALPLVRALDPPNPEVVDEALNLLVQMRAVKKLFPRGRYEPTFYGRLLSSFPLSFDASVLVLKFGEIGRLREGILLGISMDTQPLPILNPFAEDELFAEYVSCYFNAEGKNTVITGRKEVVLMANLCAFQFWQRVFKDKHRLECLKQLLENYETKELSLLLPKIEEEWCSFHNLVQPSLHHLSELYEDMLNSLHQFRPKFLGTFDGLPTYYYPYEYEHTCHLTDHQSNGDTNSLAFDDSNEQSNIVRKCLAVPFVAPDHFQTHDVASKFADIIKEIRIQHTEDLQNNRDFDINGHDGYEAVPVCKYFLSGTCNRGSQCFYSHSLTGTRPPCKFFFSLQGCRNGRSCVFSHDVGPMVSPFNPTPCLQEEEDASPESLLQLFPTSSDGCILVLDDFDFSFSAKLACHYDPSQIVTTSPLLDTTIIVPSLNGARLLWGLQHPYQTIISKEGASKIPWNEIKCVLWFPNLSSFSDNLLGQKTLIQNFFQYLAVRVLADSLHEVRLILTLNNLIFSQFQVERLGRDSFFFLTKSFIFDESSFGDLPDKVTTRRAMVASRPISYVFDLHPPTDIQFGDYAQTLHKLLESA